LKKSRDYWEQEMKGWWSSSYRILRKTMSTWLWCTRYCTRNEL